MFEISVVPLSVGAGETAPVKGVCVRILNINNLRARVEKNFKNYILGEHFYNQKPYLVTKISSSRIINTFGTWYLTETWQLYSFPIRFSLKTRSLFCRPFICIALFIIYNLTNSLGHASYSYLFNSQLNKLLGHSTKYIVYVFI